MISRRSFLRGALGLVAGTAVVGTPLWRRLVAEGMTETFTRTLMGTRVEVVIVGMPRDQAKAAARSAFVALGAIERQMTVFDPASELSQLTAGAGTGFVTVGDDLRNVLSRAEALNLKSEGAFTLAIGSLSRLWDPSRGEVPDPAAIEAAQAAVTTAGVRLTPDGNVKLTAGTVLDLGGIAKGYGVDMAVAALRRAGVDKAVVNAGGDLRMLGAGREGAWRVGIPSPARPDLVAAVLAVRDAAVATSGDYQRFFEAGGVRYHHVIDPYTGYPGRLSRSFTVVLPEGLAADAVSTAGFLLGPADGLDLVARLGGEGLAAGPTGRWSATPGLPRLEA